MAGETDEIEFERRHAVEYLKGLAAIASIFFFITVQRWWPEMEHLRLASSIIFVLVSCACCSLVVVIRSPDQRLSQAFFYVSRSLIVLRLLIQCVCALYDETNQSHFLKIVACFILPASTSRDCPNLTIFLTYLILFNLIAFLHLRRDWIEWAPLHAGAIIIQPIWVEINQRLEAGSEARKQLREVLQVRHSLAEETSTQMLNELCHGTFELDKHLRVRRVSSKLLTLFGCTEGDLLGQHFPGLLESASDMVEVTRLMDELSDRTRKFVSTRATTHAPTMSSLLTKFRDRNTVSAKSVRVFITCILGVDGETSFVLGISTDPEDDRSIATTSENVFKSDASKILSRRILARAGHAQLG